MDSERTEATSCTLCGRDRSDTVVESDTGDVFCSAGCRDVHTTIGSGQDEKAAGGEATSGDAVGTVGDRSADTQMAGEDTARAFFGIDGMHSSTSERFLESVAEGCDGVVDAEASYVTETIKVEYDPDETSEQVLRDALSTVGYTASLRAESDAFGTGADASGESGDVGIDDLLGFRYVAGVVFGTFLLFPYVIFLYPGYLASAFDVWFLDLFAGRFAFGSSSSLLLLPLFVALTSVVVFFTGLPLLRGAYVSLKMREPTTDLLVSVTVAAAFVYSVLSVVLRRTVVYFDLAVVVAAVVVAASVYEASVKRRAIDRLAEVTGGRIETASRFEDDGTTTQVDVEELAAGDTVLVREGERIPVDGTIEEGECTVEEAVVTGEPLPVVKSPGDDVVGGAVVTDDAAVVAVGDETTSSIERLSTAVWGLQSADHGIQRSANRLASVAIPVVLAMAVGVGAGSLVLGSTVAGAVLAALTAIVVGSPWALGLATPLSVASSIGDALSKGVVVFDETIFERLRTVDTVVFDKTGTLTTGEMEVLDANAPRELLSAAAALERRANHPAADAVVEAFDDGETASFADTDDRNRDDVSASSDGVSEFESFATGVRGVVDGTTVLVGNLDCFADRGWSVDPTTEREAMDARDSGHLPVVLGRDGESEGLVVVGDSPRQDWRETMQRLNDRGTETVVLTGDDGAGSGRFADASSVDHVFAGVPPTGKAAAIRRLQTDREVAMVGDGTNDAPALAAADLGIVLDGGTALASEAADLAIVDDDLQTVERAFEVASAARRRVLRNNWLALGYNGIAVALALAGILIPPLVMAAVAVCCLVLWANSSRSLVR